jgi:hypothetical protein
LPNAGPMNLGTTSFTARGSVVNAASAPPLYATMVRQLWPFAVASDALYNDTSSSTFI